MKIYVTSAPTVALAAVCSKAMVMQSSFCCKSVTYCCSHCFGNFVLGPYFVMLHHVVVFHLVILSFHLADIERASREEVKIRNRYNKVTYLTQHTIWEIENKLENLEESQEANPFRAGIPIVGEPRWENANPCTRKVYSWILYGCKGNSIVHLEALYETFFMFI